MKKLFSLIVSGMAGGLIVLAGLLYLNEQEMLSDKSVYAHLTTHNEFLDGADLPDNFTAAAEISMSAVVHISASESTARSNDRRMEQPHDPFSFFFGDNFLGTPRARSGKGSGVLVTQDGYIVTNNHVIDFADKFEVTLYDGRKYKATLIGQDPRADLAVLQIDAEGLPFLKFGDSDKVRVGEWVLAVGNPFDLTSTVTAGIVSAKGRSKIIQHKDAIEDFIQTDAVVNPGNSGGALVNTEGELIGINTAIATATGYYAGYSFAIPANMLKPVVDNIIEFGGPRGNLGIYIATIADFEAYADIDLGLSKGVVVTKVEDGGAAQYGGIIPNDVIIAIEGNSVENPDALIKMMHNQRIGKDLEITIKRKGKVKKLVVRLKA